MALEFIQIDPKTGKLLEVPPKVIPNSYLEFLLQGIQSGDRPPNLYMLKMTEGVNEADIQAIEQQQGVKAVLANTKTAYLTDPQTADLIQARIRNYSDAVAYGSLPVSEAASSVVRQGARVLVIDDEAVDADGKPRPDWGRAPITDRTGKQVDPFTLNAAAVTLGDCYALIDRGLYHDLNQAEALEQITTKQEQGLISGSSAVNIAGPLPQFNRTYTTPDDPGLVELQIFEEQLQDVITSGLPTTEAWDGLKLDYKPRRDGSVVVTWSGAAQSEGEATTEYRGKMLLRPEGDRITGVAIAGTVAQQAEVSRTFSLTVRAQDTPFQFRAGVPDWQGVIKGTCRSSSLCGELGVDAIIPRSAIKGDGKTVEVGIHEVDDLFFAKKSEAKTRVQKLGAQVLVNFPEAVKAEILPKLDQRLKELQAAQSDPRELGRLYMQKVEQKRDLGVVDEEGEVEAVERVDWLYETLKADLIPTVSVKGITFSQELETVLLPQSWQQLHSLAQQGLTVEDFVEQANQVLEAEEVQLGKEGAYQRFTVEDILNPTTTEATYPTTFETEQRGGLGQLIEHEGVIGALERYVKGEWQDAATGGVYVPCATAQPHSALKAGELGEGEVCFPDLPHGAKIAVYRSPVANSANFDVFTNNLDTVKAVDPEAVRQQGVCYMHPKDAKRLVIDFDGDTIALVPAEEIVQKGISQSRLQGLPPDQVCVPGLAEGQVVTLYYQDKDGKAQTLSLTNTTEPMERLSDLVDESTLAKQVYVSESVMSQMQPEGTIAYGYATADGLHGFQRFHQEIIDLNQPDKKPVQVEKEKKIPRDAEHGYPTFLSAALHAADNPTGLVANNGMKLEALRQEVKALIQDGTLAEKEFYLTTTVTHFTLKFANHSGGEGQIAFRNDEGEPNQTVADNLAGDVPIPPPTRDGYDFTEAIGAMVNAHNFVTSEDPTERMKQVDQQLERVEQFLFQVEGINAVQLQRAVDTPKSARVVDEAEFDFCKAAAFKPVEWVKDKKNPDRYVNGNGMQTNTNDPVGWMVSQANAAYKDAQLERLPMRAYDGFLPEPTSLSAEQVTAIQTVATAYKAAYNKAEAIEKEAKINQGPRLILKSQNGSTIEVTNLTRFDPKGQSPVWDAIRKGQPMEVQIVDNKMLWVGHSWQTKDTHPFAVMAKLDGKMVPIGTLSSQSVQALAVPGQAIVGKQFQNLSPVLEVGYDKEDAELIKDQAEETFRAWTKTIPEDEQFETACGLWHANSQKLTLKGFTEVTTTQMETYQVTNSYLKGLQYDSNEWQEARWTGQAMEARTAIELNSKSGIYGRPVIQLRETGTDDWKTLGLMSEEAYSLPIGTTATAVVQPENFILHTPAGKELTIKLAPQARLADGEEVKALLQLEGGKGRVFRVNEASGSTELLGELGQKAIEYTQKQDAKRQAQGKIPIFNSGMVVTVRAEQSPIKYATVMFEPESIQMPPQWCRRADAQKWAAMEGVELTQPIPVKEAKAKGRPVTRPAVTKAAGREPSIPQPQMAMTTETPPTRPSVPAPGSVTRPEAVPGNQAPVNQPPTRQPVQRPVPRPVPPTAASIPATRPIAASVPATTTQPVSNTPVTTLGVSVPTPPPVPPGLTTPAVTQPAPLSPEQAALQERYDAYAATVTRVLQTLGNKHPSTEAIDTAIATVIQRQMPNGEAQTRELQCLQRSPEVMRLMQESPQDTIVYVQKLLDAYQSPAKESRPQKAGVGR